VRLRLALAAALLLALVAPGIPRGQAVDSPDFLAGAAVKPIDPVDQTMATHLGGYGTCSQCPTTNVHPGDSLSARAVAVRLGQKVVAVATVDAEGWFAGYKQETVENPLGIVALRKELAATLSQEGFDVEPGDFLVGSTHCHDCPTLVGIWGKTNDVYLRYVYTQTRDAILAAVRSAVPATLAWATADAGWMNAVSLAEGNANEGWPIDKQLTTLQAKAKDGGDTVFTYATMPMHENIVKGSSLNEMSSGYFGEASRWLEARFGGVGFVQPGTLGDQTSALQGDSPATVFDTIARAGALVGSLIEDALTNRSHPVTTELLDGMEQYVVVPATNPALVGASYSDEVGAAAGIDGGIDRSVSPPFLVGTGIGVWFGALRIGDVVLASEPGEAFPHVSEGIRNRFGGAAVVFTPAQMLDQLGYYYDPHAFPFTPVYSADHHIFNISLLLAEVNVQTAGLLAARLGFDPRPGVADWTGNDLSRMAHAGVQVMVFPNPLSTPSAGELSMPFAVLTDSSRLHEGDFVGGTPLTGMGLDPAKSAVTVDWGDGSEPTVTPGDTTNFYGFHTFPAPGRYDVVATMGAERWTMHVDVRDFHTVVESADYPPNALPL
jgi:hypothetical protein